MALLVIPLNLLSLSSSREFFHRDIERTRSGLQNLADVFMNTIDAQTERADLYLYDLISQGEECAAMCRCSVGSVEYENAKYQCFRRLSDQLNQEKIISGFFLIPRGRSQCILSTHAFLLVRRELEEYLSSSQGGEGGWHILTFERGKVLQKCSSNPFFIYGCILDLDSRERELEKSSWNWIT